MGSAVLTERVERSLGGESMWIAVSLHFLTMLSTSVPTANPQRVCVLVFFYEASVHEEGQRWEEVGRAVVE